MFLKTLKKLFFNFFLENWLNYLLYANRNLQLPGDNLGSTENYNDQSWGSFLRSSWGSPTPWSPSTSQNLRSPTENNVGHHYTTYNPLREHEGAINQELHQSSGGHLSSMNPNPTILNHALFSQNPTSLTGNPMPSRETMETVSKRMSLN